MLASVRLFRNVIIPYAAYLQFIAMPMLVSCWIFYGVATLVIILRIVAKLRSNFRLGGIAIDDLLMVLALVSGLHLIL